MNVPKLLLLFLFFCISCLCIFYSCREQREISSLRCYLYSTPQKAYCLYLDERKLHAICGKASISMLKAFEDEGKTPYYYKEFDTIFQEKMICLPYGNINKLKSEINKLNKRVNVKKVADGIKDIWKVKLIINDNVYFFQYKQSFNDDIEKLVQLLIEYSPIEITLDSFFYYKEGNK